MTDKSTFTELYNVRGPYRITIGVTDGETSGYIRTVDDDLDITEITVQPSDIREIIYALAAAAEKLEALELKEKDND